MSTFPHPQFKFLAGLTKHNDRDWFAKHKEAYQVAYAEWKEVALEITTQVATWKPDVFPQPDYYKVFRIYRDVRFSKNKLPYKTHFSTEITPEGRETGWVGYYLQIMPGGGSFLGAACFPPQSQDLFALRLYISRNYKRLQKILDASRFSLTDPMGKLKTIPRGFAKDDPARELLAYKAWALVHRLSDKEVAKPNYPKLVSTYLQEITPWVEFFQAAKQEIIENRTAYTPDWVNR